MNITPKSLIDETLSIGFALIVKRDFFCVLFELDGLNIMYFVFLILRDSLLAINQLSMFFNSLFPFCTKRLLFFAERITVVIQCMTEKLIVITIKLDYSKVPSKSTVPTSDYNRP